MTVRLHWFLPTGGDGRTLVDRHAYAPTTGGANRPVKGVRPPDIEYLAEIASTPNRSSAGWRSGPESSLRRSPRGWRRPISASRLSA